MDILERLKIVAETTSEQWPTASIDFEYRAAVKEIETLRAALTALKEAVEYTPLGVRGIKAVEQARIALMPPNAGGNQPQPEA